MLETSVEPTANTYTTPVLPTPNRTPARKKRVSIHGTKNMDVKTNSYWQKMVADWRKSGKTQADFCKERNVNPHTFKNWSSKVSSKTSKVTNGKTAPKTAPKIAKKKNSPSDSVVAGAIRAVETIKGCQAANDTADTMLSTWSKVVERLCTRGACVSCDNVRRGARALLAAVL